MAGINVGTAWVTIAASAKGIGKGIEKDLKGAGTKAGEKFGTEFGDSAKKKTDEAFSSFGTKAIVGAAAVGVAFFGLASAAGNLSAAVAANEQVLGDASQAVQDFAETGVESVGLSETAILNAATTFGQLGKVIGLTGTELSTFSTDLVVLAADMAAFKNVTPTQALEDLQSAFAGQPEVLRKYGVFLDDATLKTAYFNETGIRVSGTLTAQQRLIATNAELWRQTGDIQGQAAREAGGFERSIANLKAVVGNVAADFGAPIVGFASTLLSTVSSGIETLGSWNEETGGMLATGLAAGIGIAAAGAAALGVVSKVKDAAEGFGRLSKATKAATLITGGLALAVVAGFAIYGLMTQHQREIEARTREVADALDEATTEAWDYAEAAEAAGDTVDGFEVAQAALSDALTSTGEDGKKLTEAFGALGLQTDDAAEIFLAFGENSVDALADVAAAAGLLGEDAGLAIQFVAEMQSLGSGPAWANLVDNFNGNADAAKAWLDENLLVIDSMTEVQRQAGDADLNGVAQQFLNTAVAADEDAEALIKQAEAQAGANRNGDQALEVYLALQDILAKMSPAERDVAQEALGLAGAQTEAASAGAELNEVAASTIDMTTDLEDALSAAAGEADAFTSAIDRLVGGQLNFQEATDELAAGVAELDEQIRLAQEGEEGYALTLDGSTAAGRDNREMIRSRISDVLGMADAELEAGHGIDAASQSLDQQRQALIDQVQPFFETREAAEFYINTLGLTPDAITTAVDLAGEEVARAALEEYITTAGDVPESVITIINALIDDGEYARAEAMLVQLERTRYAKVIAQYSGPAARGPGGLGAVAVGYGGYFEANNPTFGLMGEAPWDEAMLTVGNMANLRRQLQDDRIAGPILDALPRVEPMGSGGGRRVREGDINLISYEQNPTPGGVATALAFARR